VNIQKVSYQGSQSLKEFYSELAGDERRVYSECGKKMLQLLDKLKPVPWDDTLWGSTSLTSLNLSDVDDYEPSALTNIHHNGHVFRITFNLPQAEAPWPAPTAIEGYTEDVDEAAEMVQIALRHCARREKDSPRVSG